MSWISFQQTCLDVVERRKKEKENVTTNATLVMLCRFNYQRFPFLLVPMFCTVESKEESTDVVLAALDWFFPCRLVFAKMSTNVLAPGSWFRTVAMAASIDPAYIVLLSIEVSFRRPSNRVLVKHQSSIPHLSHKESSCDSNPSQSRQRSYWWTKRMIRCRLAVVWESPLCDCTGLRGLLRSNHNFHSETYRTKDSLQCGCAVFWTLLLVEYWWWWWWWW